MEIINNELDIQLIEKNYKLSIILVSDGDIHMVLSNGEVITNKEDKTLCFDITKENILVFSAFNSLYEKIINAKIPATNYDYKKSSQYKKLVDNNAITWISDDGLEEAEDRMVISKIDDDRYRLSFIRNTKKANFGFKNPFGITVRIRMSGSRYDPFNILFTTFYRELKTIDMSNQVNLEEYKIVNRTRKKREGI